MALGANEKQRSAVPVQDLDGRLIVVGPNGVPISGGAGGGGADPLSDGDDAGALPTKTLWVAGADGAVLRGMRVDATGRPRVLVENIPTVQGDIAHDAVDSGNALKIGGKALPGTP